MEHLSNKIRELRFKNGEMTQKELATLIGVSRQTINAIENNRYAPSIKIVIRMADVFHTSVESVFNYEYEGQPERMIITIKLQDKVPAITRRNEDRAASLPAPSAVVTRHRNR
ncbi:MAG: helix-turn-helix transcriptional regulator [Pseudomonadota bacterium]